MTKQIYDLKIEKMIFIDFEETRARAGIADNRELARQTKLAGHFISEDRLSKMKNNKVDSIKLVEISVLCQVMKCLASEFLKELPMEEYREKMNTIEYRLSKHQRKGNKKAKGRPKKKEDVTKDNTSVE